MAKKRETRLVKRIRERLKAHFHIWLFKTHGNEFQQAGIPDLLGCCVGIFLGMEVKLPKTGVVSKVQKEVMREIKKRGGGYCAVITTPDEAVEFVTRVLRKEGKLLAGTKTSAKESRRVRSRTTALRPLLQTKVGKDLYRRRAH